MRIALIVAILLAGCADPGEPIQRPDGPAAGAFLLPDDYILDERATEWVIEIDYVAAYKPGDAELSHMQRSLEELVHKDTIQIIVDDAIEGRGVWTPAYLQEKQAEHQDYQNGDGRVVTYVLYVGGQFEQEGVLGIAMGNDLVGIFQQRIEEACNTNPLCFALDGGQDMDRLKSAVLLHEMGHIIGLVNNGIPMVNDHSDGGAHSSNPDSVMYASADSTGLLGLEDIPMTFDAEDRRDIGCFGGKPAC